jgi:hypothetical protein
MACCRADFAALPISGYAKSAAAANIRQSAKRVSRLTSADRQKDQQCRICIVRVATYDTLAHHNFLSCSLKPIEFHMPLNIRLTAKSRRSVKMLGAMSALAVVLYSATALAQVSTRYPYCLQGDDYPGWSNCTFATLQQCQATASGTYNECMANPWYRADADAPAESGNSANADNPISVGPPPR